MRYDFHTRDNQPVPFVGVDNDKDELIACFFIGPLPITICEKLAEGIVNLLNGKESKL